MSIEDSRGSSFYFDSSASSKKGETVAQSLKKSFGQIDLRIKAINLKGDSKETLEELDRIKQLMRKESHSLQTLSQHFPQLVNRKYKILGSSQKTLLEFFQDLTEKIHSTESKLQALGHAENRVISIEESSHEKTKVKFDSQEKVEELTRTLRSAINSFIPSTSIEDLHLLIEQVESSLHSPYPNRLFNQLQQKLHRNAQNSQSSIKQYTLTELIKLSQTYQTALEEAILYILDCTVKGLEKHWEISPQELTSLHSRKSSRGIYTVLTADRFYEEMLMNNGRLQQWSRLLSKQLHYFLDTDIKLLSTTPLHLLEKLKVYSDIIQLNIADACKDYLYGLRTQLIDIIAKLREIREFPTAENVQIKLDPIIAAFKRLLHILKQSELILDADDPLIEEITLLKTDLMRFLEIAQGMQKSSIKSLNAFFLEWNALDDLLADLHQERDALEVNRLHLNGHAYCAVLKHITQLTYAYEHIMHSKVSSEFHNSIKKLFIEAVIRASVSMSGYMKEVHALLIAQLQENFEWIVSTTGLKIEGYGNIHDSHELLKFIHEQLSEFKLNLSNTLKAMKLNELKAISIFLNMRNNADQVLLSQLNTLQLTPNSTEIAATVKDLINVPFRSLNFIYKGIESLLGFDNTKHSTEKAYSSFKQILPEFFDNTYDIRDYNYDLSPLEKAVKDDLEFIDNTQHKISSLLERTTLHLESFHTYFSKSLKHDKTQIELWSKKLQQIEEDLSKGHLIEEKHLLSYLHTLNIISSYKYHPYVKQVNKLISQVKSRLMEIKTIVDFTFYAANPNDISELKLKNLFKKAVTIFTQHPEDLAQLVKRIDSIDSSFAKVSHKEKRLLIRDLRILHTIHYLSRKYKKPLPQQIQTISEKASIVLNQIIEAYYIQAAILGDSEALRLGSLAQEYESTLSFNPKRVDEIIRHIGFIEKNFDRIKSSMPLEKKQKYIEELIFYHMLKELARHQSLTFPKRLNAALERSEAMLTEIIVLLNSRGNSFKSLLKGTKKGIQEVLSKRALFIPDYVSDIQNGNLHFQETPDDAYAHFISSNRSSERGVLSREMKERLTYEKRLKSSLQDYSSLTRLLLIASLKGFKFLGVEDNNRGIHDAALELSRKRLSRYDKIISKFNK